MLCEIFNNKKKIIIIIRSYYFDEHEKNENFKYTLGTSCIKINISIDL
jgi:hypothetical protein